MTRETKRKKTSEEILKANLNKSLDRLKHKVAEREVLWLEILQDSIPCCLEANENDTKKAVRQAAEIAEEVVRVYEERWGKG